MSAEPGPHRMGWGKTIAYSLVPLLVLATLVETGARIWERISPPLPVDVGLSFLSGSSLFVEIPGRTDWLMTDPQKTFVPQSIAAELGLPQSPDHAVATFVWQSFPKRKPERTFRVFFIGESSVNYAQSYFRDMALELKLMYPDWNFEIINCGGCAYGSHRLALIFQEVLQYQPDAICLYLGNNEFEEQEQLQHARLDTVPLQKLLWSSAAMRMVRDKVALAALRRKYQEHNEKVLSQEITGWDINNSGYTPAEIEDRMGAFESNVANMILMARQASVPLVMGSIPSNLWKPDLPQAAMTRYQAEVAPLFDRGEYEDGMQVAQEILSESPRHQASATENEILRRLAEKYEVPFAEVMERVSAAEPHGVPGETLFSDHCHLNEKGNPILADCFREKLEVLVQPRTRQ